MVRKDENSPAPLSAESCRSLAQHDLQRGLRNHESCVDNRPNSHCDPEPQVGQKLGKCHLEAILGKGGSCTVFRARHESLAVPVAVKVLLPDDDARWQQSYLQLQTEAHLLARLNHPHIVRILDFEDHPILPYLVLELAGGRSLHDLIRHQGRLTQDQATALILQAAEGLSALWKLNAVHRDVKPANILLTAEGVVKIADLGQAALLSSATQGPAMTVVGTAAYLAPEQFLAPQTVDSRADMYGLGATFYEAVTGETPFTGRSCQEILLHQVQESPRPPHLLVPQLDRHLSKVILTMLARDRANRYPSIKALQDALAHRSCRFWTDRYLLDQSRRDAALVASKTCNPRGKSRPELNLTVPRSRSLRQHLADAFHLAAPVEWLQ